MCGIAGFFDSKGAFDGNDLNNMLNALVHRGPDAVGVFTENAVSLGHRRLSILDLREEANQPMYSHDNRYVIVYNGEVYNFKEITDKYKIPLKTYCDTEVIIELFRLKGVDFVHELNGMFSLAIYDRERQSLYLFRDRIGIKPLFYYWDGNILAFASETKALLQLKQLDWQVNEEAMRDYFFLEHIPADASIFKKVNKLTPGCFLEVDKSGVKKHTYYDLMDKVEEEYRVEEEEVAGKLEELLASSIQYRQVSDVPLGAFLSGGTDSSIITSIFQKNADNKIKTFTIGFDVSSFDESVYAEKVAREIGSDHTLRSISSETSFNTINHLVQHYDEPFAAASAIPSLIVCKEAKDLVTVALGGDGGDELFFGYGYYDWYDRYAKYDRIGGYPLRKLMALLLSAGNDRAKRAAKIFDYNDKKSAWLHIWSQEQSMFTKEEIEKLFGKEYRHQTLLDRWDKINAMDIHPYRKISLFDLQNYLPNDLLYKVDIASMASSLEVRVPFLDHRLVEYSLNIPVAMRKKPGNSKYILKKVLEKYLPKELIYRQKWGFPAPVASWLEKDLSFMINEFLNEKEIKAQGIFDSKYISGLTKEFKNGRKALGIRLWSMIVFQKWYKNYIG